MQELYLQGQSVRVEGAIRLRQALKAVEEVLDVSSSVQERGRLGELLHRFGEQLRFISAAIAIAAALFRY